MSSLHLPLPLALLLIVAGLWSVVAWPMVMRMVNRSAATGGGRARPAEEDAGSRPASIPLIVVAISLTLAVATIVVGLRAL